MLQTPDTLSLEQLLVATRDSMQQLLAVLNRECLLFKKNNIEELENLTREKITLTEEIERNEQQRLQLLRSQKLNPGEPKQWLSSNKLVSTWAEIKTLSEQAQKQNQVNGMVIHANRRRIQAQIDILNAAEPANELTYSSSGENISQRRSNTLAQV